MERGRIRAEFNSYLGLTTEIPDPLDDHLEKNELENDMLLAFSINGTIMESFVIGMTILL